MLFYLLKSPIFYTELYHKIELYIILILLIILGITGAIFFAMILIEVIKDFFKKR